MKQSLLTAGHAGWSGGLIEKLFAPELVAQTMQPGVMHAALDVGPHAASISCLPALRPFHCTSPCDTPVGLTLDSITDSFQNVALSSSHLY